MKQKLKTMLALLAVLVCGGAWAEAGDIINIRVAQQSANLSVAQTTLASEGKIPATAWVGIGQPSSGTKAVSANKMYNVSSQQEKTAPANYTVTAYSEMGGNWALFNNENDSSEVLALAASTDYGYLKEWASNRDRSCIPGTLEISNIPFAKYTVYIYFQGATAGISTGSRGKALEPSTADVTQLDPIRVDSGNATYAGDKLWKVDANGELVDTGSSYSGNFSASSGPTINASDCWGARNNVTAALGTNVVKIPNCFGTFKISYWARASGPAAIQIVEIPLSPTEVDFTKANATDWENCTLPSSAMEAETTDHISFAGKDAYKQTLGDKEATVANVTRATSKMIAGLYALNGQNAGLGEITRDVYLMVSGGTPWLVTGGEDAQYNCSTKTIPTGNILVNVCGENTVADMIFGAGHRGGGEGGVVAEVIGNVGVVVKDGAQVKGPIVGGWSSVHNRTPIVTGNTSVLIQNIQTQNDTVYPILNSQNYPQSGVIVGGSIHLGNYGGGQITGNTSVEVAIAEGEGSFGKMIVGGSYKTNALGDNAAMTVSGNSSVKIAAPNTVTFSQDIIGGGRSTDGSNSAVSGNSSVTIDGGRFTATIYAGGNHTTAPVSGTATLTLNGGTYTGSIKAGTARGAKTLAVNGDITVTPNNTPNNTAIEGFDSLTIADTKTLTLVAEEAKAMSLSVPGTGSIAKTGAGVLTLNDLPEEANYAVAITDGGLTLGGNANGLTIDMNSESGTLTIGTSRPTVNVRAGSVTLTATDAEIASGAIAVTVPSDAAAVSVEQVTVLDGAGHELNVASVAKTSDTQLTITLQKFEPITGEKLISELHLSDDAAGTLEIRGGATEDAAFTVTFDAVLPAGVTVSVSGYVKFVTGRDITSVPLSSFGYANGTVVEIVADPGEIEIPAGLTLCIDANDRTTTAPLTVDGPLTGSGAVAIKNGAVKFTNQNGYTGGLTVKSGAIAMTSTMTGFGATGSDPGITVENGGAVDLANTKDNFGYHYVIAGTGVNNSGALYSSQEMWAASRQTSQIKLSDHATIVCSNEWGLVGNEYSATVLNLAGHTLTKQGPADFILTNAGMGGATDGTINVEAGGIHTANNPDALGNYILKMAEGTTLNLESNMTINSLVGQGEGVKVKGNGTLTANSYTGKVVVESGLPTMTGVAQCARASFVVKSEATMNVGRTDFFSYNQNGYGTVDVYGTLNFGANRQTLRNAWTFNFYSGCTVNGFGDNDQNWPCAMLIWNANHTDNIKFLKDTEDETGLVNFNATLGLENNATFYIDEGVTVVCNGATSGQNTRNFINRYGNGKVVTKTGEGTLRINTACTATIKLTDGTFKSPNELTVEKTNANKKIVTSTETEDQTTIHVWSLAQRDPGTVYLKCDDTYVNENNQDVDLIEGDAIVIDTRYGNLWPGHIPPSVVGHTVTIASSVTSGNGVNLEGDIPASITLVANNESTWLYGDIGANADISGNTTMYAGYNTGTQTTTIADGATISCSFVIESTRKAVINGDVNISGPITCGGEIELADGATLTVGTELTGHVTSNDDTKKVGYTFVDGVYTYMLVDPATPIKPTEGGETIVVPEVPAGGIAIEPGANVQVPPETTAIVVKYGDTVLNPVEGPKYVSVKVNESTGKVELETTNDAKPAPTAIAMSMPTEGEGEEATDKVQFTITNPIPGLFYSIVSADGPTDDDFTSGTDSTGVQATGSDPHTTSIDMPTDAKVKYFRVRVKATK